MSVHWWSIEDPGFWKGSAPDWCCFPGQWHSLGTWHDEWSCCPHPPQSQRWVPGSFWKATAGNTIATRKQAAFTLPYCTLRLVARSNWNTQIAVLIVQQSVTVSWRRIQSVFPRTVCEWHRQGNDRAGRQYPKESELIRICCFPYPLTYSYHATFLDPNCTDRMRVWIQPVSLEI